jgi:hypothetical protein
MQLHESPDTTDPRDAAFEEWAESRYDAGEPCDWLDYVREADQLTVTLVAPWPPPGLELEDCPF